MPTDRHEALHLILGFCKDHGLHETYCTLLREAGMAPLTEELARHVSLMRILLDWKRAFEARFNGTPRIIQAVSKQDPSMPTVLAGLEGMQGGGGGVGGGQGGFLPADFLNGGPGAYQALHAAGQQLPGASADNGSSLQTIQYVNAPMFRQPVQIMGPTQGPAQHQFLMQQPQQQVQPQQGPPGMMQQHPGGVQGVGLPGAGDSAEQAALLRQSHAGAGMPRTSTYGDGVGAGSAQQQQLGLPPRAPQGGVVPSHSSSLYSPHQQDADPDCSRDTTHDWQLGGGDGGEETGHSGGRWGAVAGPGMSALTAARRGSTPGAPQPTTRLKNGSEPITQDTFLTVINTVGHGAVATQLFDFKRPQRGSSSTARRSAILQLDDAQHDAMYALAGCEDVNFLISNVQADVRVAMHKVFGIDKESFTVWFKNRGRNPSKQQGAAAAVATRPAAPKRIRTADANTPSP